MMDMQPENSYSTPNNSKDPYGFIMSAGGGKPVKQPVVNQSSTKGRLLVAGIIGALLLFIGGAVFSIILNSGPHIEENLNQVAFKQAEVIRLSTLATQKARSSNTANFAYSTKLSMVTDQAATLAYLKTQGKALKAEELANRKNAQNDSALAKAEQAGSYDETVTKLIKDTLAAYQKELKTTYDLATDSKGKTLLIDNYNHAALLIKAN